MAVRLAIYYEAAEELARGLTAWSKKLDRKERYFVVCTGGGPGIMEAANRGASGAKGLSVGLTISIPDEEFDNPYVIRELHFYFHSSREETAGREGYGGAAHEEVRFALDSQLERDGFELPVPRSRNLTIPLERN